MRIWYAITWRAGKNYLLHVMDMAKMGGSLSVVQVCTSMYRLWKLSSFYTNLNIPCPLHSYFSFVGWLLTWFSNWLSARPDLRNWPGVSPVLTNLSRITKFNQASEMIALDYNKGVLLIFGSHNIVFGSHKFRPAIVSKARMDDNNVTVPHICLASTSAESKMQVAASAPNRFSETAEGWKVEVQWDDTRFAPARFCSWSTACKTQTFVTQSKITMFHIHLMTQSGTWLKHRSQGVRPLSKQILLWPCASREGWLRPAARTG